MNKSIEISKVQNALKIPVTDLNFNDQSVTIFSNEINIGNIPYYSHGGVITYDNHENVLNWLNWVEIYKFNKVNIDNLIIEISGTSDIKVGYGIFRNLYVKNTKDEILFTVNCQYENNIWKVIKNK